MENILKNVDMLIIFGDTKEELEAYSKFLTSNGFKERGPKFLIPNDLRWFQIFQRHNDKE